MNPAAGTRARPRARSLPRVTIGAEAVAIGAVTAAGAALRFSTLGAQSLWKDEAVTVVRILKPGLGATLTTIPHSEATPPLYYVLAWAWTRVFGTSEVGIRSLSALIGTAMVPVAYLAARRLLSRTGAVVTAALVAFSPYLIWYSQEARAYVLLAFLSTLSLLLFLRARERGDRASFLGWGVVSALALATHYFAVFIVGAEAAWLLWERRRAVVPALVVPVIAGAALLPLALHQERNGHDGWIHRLSLSGRVGNTVKFFLGSPGSAPALLVLLAGALVVAGLVMLVTAPIGDRRSVVVPASIAAAVIGVPLLLYLVGEDFFFHRNVIGAWVPAAMVVAAGFASRRFGLVLAAALCAVFLATVVAVDTNARYQRANWRLAANSLGRASGPRAIVTPSLGDEPLEYYLGRRTALLRGARRIAEVDVLGWPAADEPLPAAPAGMRRTELGKVGAFTVIRYRATAAPPVTARSLAALHLGSDHPGVLFEP